MATTCGGTFLNGATTASCMDISTSGRSSIPALSPDTILDDNSIFLVARHWCQGDFGNPSIFRRTSLLCRESAATRMLRHRYMPLHSQQPLHRQQHHQQHQHHRCTSMALSWTSTTNYRPTCEPALTSIQRHTRLANTSSYNIRQHIHCRSTTSHLSTTQQQVTPQKQRHYYAKEVAFLFRHKSI